MGLVLLGAFPVIMGGVRVTELASGAEVTPENARFFDQPLPVVLHIFGAAIFLIVGAFQFHPGLRRGSWHRRVGRVVLPAGIVTASSGMWMVLFYPYDPVDWPLPSVVQLGVGTAWNVFLVLGYLAVRRRDFAGHRRWMIRAYALGQGTGVQPLMFLLWAVVVGGDPGEGLAGDLLLISGWVVSVSVAEMVIRRQRRPMTLSA